MHGQRTSSLTGLIKSTDLMAIGNETQDGDNKIFGQLFTKVD